MKYSPNKLIGFALIAVALVLPFIIRNSYYMHIIIMVYINAILAMGFSLIYSTGLITLGASAFWGIGAYASTLLVMRTGLSFWLAMPAAMIITGIVALCFGLFIVRYAGIGFIVFTLLICFVIERMYVYIKGFGGWGGIIAIPSPNNIHLPLCGVIDFGTKTAWYYLSLLLLLVTILCLYALYSSRIGRAWRAIRLDSRLAQAVGVYVYFYRLLAFVVASSFAGLAGSFYAHYSEVISPEGFSLTQSISIQIYAILGGLEYYILGPLAGSLVYTFVPDFLQISPSIEPYITGLTLIFIVIFLPNGLVGLPGRIARGLSRLYAIMIGKRKHEPE